MLILSRKVDESIIIGDDIIVSIVDIKGDQVKIGIEAPKEIKVYRREVYEAIQSENQAAVRTSPVLPVIKRLADSKPATGRRPSSGPASGSGSETKTPTS